MMRNMILDVMSWVMDFVYGLAKGLIGGFVLWPLIWVWYLVSAFEAVVYQKYDELPLKVIKSENASRLQNAGEALGQLIGMWALPIFLIIWLS